MITQIVKDKLFYDKLFYSEKSIGIICCNHNEYLQLCKLFSKYDSPLHHVLPE